MKTIRPSLTFYELTAEEQAPFREKAALVEKKFIEMAGAEGEKLLKAMKAEVAAAEKAKK
jgi:TRAP-type C4-dicarboxylate transport system substrate-binding protein